MNFLRVTIPGLVAALAYCPIHCYLEGTKAQAPIAIKIVQLGDSFAAGNGARGRFGRRNYEDRICYRSPTAWGPLYARQIGENPRYDVTFQSNACNGAYVADLYDQMSMVDEATDLVLVAAGANDARFYYIVINCFVQIGVNQAKRCRDILDESRSILPSFQEAMKNVVRAIWGRMGGFGKIVLVEYPNITLDKKKIIRDKDFQIDMPRAVRQLLSDANAVYEKSCYDANQELGVDACFFYNKTMQLFEGHEPHPSLLVRNPAGWINELNTLKVPVEFFHVNAKGHRNLGLALAEEGTFGLFD